MKLYNKWSRYKWWWNATDRDDWNKYSSRTVFLFLIHLTANREMEDTWWDPLHPSSLPKPLVFRTPLILLSWQISIKTIKLSMVSYHSRNLMRLTLTYQKNSKVSLKFQEHLPPTNQDLKLEDKTFLKLSINNHWMRVFCHRVSRNKESNHINSSNSIKNQVKIR